MSFDAMPHDVWPEVAGLIPRPWPRSVAAHDLRWHAAEHAVYGRPLPAVRELAERWGWTRTRTHELIADAPGWADEARPWGWRAADKKRTTGGQEADTANGRTPTNIETADKIRTAGGQDPDSRADPISAPLHPSPHEDTQPPADAGPPRAEPGSTTEAPPHGPSPATPVPGADRRDRQEPPGSDTPDAPAEPATLAARGPRTRRDAGGDGSGKPDVAELYRLYRARHPRKALTATPDDRKHLARMLTEAGSPDAAALYLDWIHEADDDRARQVRGEAPWPDGRISPMLSLEELARKVGSRLPHAEAWAVRGRRSPVVSGGSAPPTMQPDEAGALWDWAMGEVKAKGRTRGAEEVFTAAEPRRARAAVVIRDLGLWSRMCDQPEHFLKPERQRFIGAFNAAQKREAM